jgi:hypothetical protein
MASSLLDGFRFVKTTLVTSFFQRLGLHFLIFIWLLGLVFFHVLGDIFKLNIVFSFKNLNRLAINFKITYQQGICKILLKIPEITVDSSLLFLRVFMRDGI